MTEYRYSRMHLISAFTLPFLIAIHLACIFQFNAIAQTIAALPPSDYWLLQPFAIRIIFILFTVMLFGYGWYWLKEFRRLGIRISLGPDGIDYGTKNNQRRVSLRSVDQVLFKTKWVGGSATIVCSGGAIQITTGLKGIVKFLDELKALLDANGLSDRYDPEAFKELRSRALRFQHP